MTDLFPTSLEKEATARVIRARRTIQVFTNEKPELSLIKEAIDLARWAPNHKLTEPWRFYILGDQAARSVAELNAELVREKRGEAAAENKLKRWLAVPGWVCLTAKRSEDAFREKEDYAACCCAAQNMMLAHWSAGIGMKWTTGPVIRSEAFLSLLGIPPTEYVVGLFMYGYPAETPTTDRRAIAEVTTVLP